jgi:uncharacterized protein YukE
MTSGDGPAGRAAGGPSRKPLDDIEDFWDIDDVTTEVMEFASAAQGTVLGDPLEALGVAGLGSLTHLVAPLKDALNLVTGDPEGLTDKAEQWASVAGRLRTLGPHATEHAHATVSDWAGTAGDAFRAKISRFDSGVRGVAGQADHVAEVLRVSSTLIDAAQNIIKSIMASWVEYTFLTQATAAATARFTFGASDAAGQAAIAGEAAVACSRGAETVGRASTIMERLAGSVHQLEGSFSQLTFALQEEARTMRQAEGGLRRSQHSGDTSAQSVTDETGF